MKWIVLPYSESYFEETKYILLISFFKFHVFKNTIERIAFENAYESSIIFQPFLYANMPSNAPTFFSVEANYREFLIFISCRYNFN